MVSVNPSSLIGAQAYATQLRRHYTQEETERVFTLNEERGRRPNPQAGERIRPAPAAEEHARKTALLRNGAGQGKAPGNPTLGEAAEGSNPPAQPLYSTARREAPNPNAQLRNVRPGTHLDITI